MKGPLMYTLQDSEAWTRLSDRALWWLRHPDQASPLEGPQNLELQLRLWCYPPWGSHLSWGLFLPTRKEGRSLVRESRWNATADLRRLSSAVTSLKRGHCEDPSLRLREAWVDTERLKPLLVQAPDVLLTWAPRRAPASGSSVYGLEGFRSLAHARFEWGKADEEGGSELVSWAVRLRSLLRTSLRERERA